MKKIILGIIALSSVAMAAQDKTIETVNKSNTAKGTFANRISFSYLANGQEKEKDDNFYHDNPNYFDKSYEVDYKLLYNLTNRFRLGGELGIDDSYFSDDFNKYIKIGDDSIAAFLLGVTGEYDVYKVKNLALYIDGSLGGVAGKNTFENSHKEKIGDIDPKYYMKLGVGARFNNGIGFEIGRRVISYDIEYKYDSTHTMYRGQTYVQLNYTF